MLGIQFRCISFKTTSWGQYHGFTGTVHVVDRYNKDRGGVDRAKQLGLIEVFPGYMTIECKLGVAAEGDEDFMIAGESVHMTREFGAA